MMWALLAQVDPPGTVKLTSKSGFLIETQNGDAYFLVLPEEPVRFSVVGPSKVQVDFRINLAKRKTPAKPSLMLELIADGAVISKLKINAKSGKSTWRNTEISYRPSEPAEFFLEVGEGVHEVELRVDQAAKLGGALYLVDAAQATRPLSAGAPVLKIPAITASGPPPPTPAASPAPSTSAPTAIEAAPAAPPQVEPSREVRDKSEAVAAPKQDARRLLTALVTAGVALQEERSAFNRNGAGDIWLALQVALPSGLHAGAGWEGRFGSVAVPLTTTTAPVATPEVRHAVWVDFGWTPTLWRAGDIRLDGRVNASYRLASHSNQVASSLYGVAGADLGLQLQRGFAAVFAAGGFAPRLHDSTAATVATGSFVGRAHWTAGVRADILPMLAVLAAYRGELLLRSRSFRQADALHVGVLVSFL